MFIPMSAQSLCSYINYRSSKDKRKNSIIEVHDDIKKTANVYEAFNVPPTRRTFYVYGEATFGDYTLTSDDWYSMMLAGMIHSVHRASEALIKSIIWETSIFDIPTRNSMINSTLNSVQTLNLTVEVK